MGVRSFILVAGACLINWLLAHNCYLVAFLCQLAHLSWALGVTASFLMFPHDFVVDRVTMKCRCPVWVGGGAQGDMSSEEVMVFTSNSKTLLFWALVLKFYT